MTAARGLPRRCAAELAGTFVLVMLGPGAAIVATRTDSFGQAGIAAAFGIAVAVVVAALGPVSGAHINPAVTVALCITHRFPARDVAAYVAAQCTGAIGASLLLRHLLGTDAGTGATLPAVGIGAAFVVEAGFTALLGAAIVLLADRDEASVPVTAVALGAVVFAGALFLGPLTGGSFNPARSLGPAVAGGQWRAHWLYWLAPILGMTAGALAGGMGRHVSRSPRSLHPPRSA